MIRTTTSITISVTNMVPSIFSLFTLFLFVSPRLCSARDNMTFNNPITDDVKDTLVSAGERFELGFFSPNDDKRYVGIWYYGYKPRTVVWVANRENPLTDSTGVLSIAENGSLQVLDVTNRSYWSPKIGSPPPSSSFSWRLKLMDSGNLVLSQEVENQGSEILWQSFDHPTDTFLPGMKIDENLELTSWTSLVDPEPGDFKFLLDQERKNQYIITKNGSLPYWKSGVSGSFINYDGRRWQFQEVSYLLRNFSRKPVGSKPYDNTTRTIDYSNITPPVPIPFNYTRLVMNSNGQIQFFLWQNEKSSWTSLWLEPSDRCKVFDACGTFASCNSHNRMHCKCLPGFQPKLPDNWNSGIFAEGCTRTSTLCNEDVNLNFLELKMMKAGKPDAEYYFDEHECMNECFGKCNCQAYSYHKAEKVGDNVTCWIWLKDLNNIQEQFDMGRDLNVRVPGSAIKFAKGNCDNCGTNRIPYPLSSGPNCGDPMYYSFSCEASSGQLFFKVFGANYRVTGIDVESHKFSIQVVDADDCSSIESMGKYPKPSQSLPFHVIRGCNADNNSFTLDPLFEDKGSIEVEIAWNPPPEPLCNSPEDCDDWPHSTCNGAGDRMRRCLCNKSFQWDPEKVNCIPAFTKRWKSLYSLLLGVITTAMIILCAAFYLFYSRRAKRVTSRENRESIQGKVAFHFYDSERRVRDLIYSDQFSEEDKKGIDVPFFDMELILAATDNFSDANKLGEGGFGPVYKGKFPGGQEIAIKRLSSSSVQGLEEFKNEVVLIAKLQHRNLVRLLGYCIEGQEKILLYEYMPNKSLDSFIFDRTLCVLLNWELRFNIIVGIARGLLYLHHDSRLKIIHRDLKTSNVLLDEEMNPKISDFGLARIFGGKQTEESTQRVVGTYGYMSPEYALDGVFSIKSDVFSFGVVVLEILSGKRNTAFYKPDQAFSLLGYTWRLWKEEKALDLMDQALCETCNANEFVRCVNVGLLCSQEDPWDRPTMSNVVFMLGGETASLPSPKQPAFAVRRPLSSTASSSSKPDSFAQLTNSVEQGR